MTAAAGSIYWSIVIWYSMFNYFLGAKLKIICWPGSFVACTVPLQHQLCWNHYPVSQNVNYVQESFHTLHLWVMLKLSKNNMAFLSTLPFYRVPILPFNRALWFFFPCFFCHYHTVGCSSKTVFMIVFLKSE